jgi:zinc protease
MILFRLAVATALLLSPLTARAEVAIQEVISPGGITAWLVEEPSIPFVAMDIRFKGGVSLDTLDAAGAIYLMTGLLEEGAGERDARAFSEAREAVAARLSFNAFRDSIQIDAQFLTENRAQSIALLKDALNAPRFDPDAVERVRGQVQSIIDSNATDPQEIAGNTMAALAFPAHPYGAPIEGTGDSVAALTREDLMAAHRAVFARDRVYVGVTGDISAAELGPILDDLLGGLPATGAPMPDTATYALAGGTTVVDFPSPQSVVAFGHEGLDRHDPDFFAAFVMNHILGGSGFDSRLMYEVREKRGLTYGIGSFLLPRDHAAQIMGQFSASNANIGEATDVIRTIWADMAENGVRASELEAAQTYLTGAYPLRFDGNAQIAGILTGMQMEDLGIDYIATRNAKVLAITSEDIRRVATRLLRPDDLHFVIVGQPDGVE